MQEGLFTHLATADEKDKTAALRQIAKYDAFDDALKKEGISFEIKHVSNSAAIIDMPQANHGMVRLGIALYGMYPSDEVDKSADSTETSTTAQKPCGYGKDSSSRRKDRLRRNI